jgi:hypothetical protein
MVKQKIELAKVQLNNHLRAGENSALSIFDAAELMDCINFSVEKASKEENLFFSYSLN